MTSEESIDDNADLNRQLIERGHMRRMGHLENYFALVERQELYSNFSVHCTLNHPLDYSYLRDILREIILQNSILAHAMVHRGYPDPKAYYQGSDFLATPYTEYDYIRVIDRLKLGDVVLDLGTGIGARIFESYKAADYKVTKTVSELIAGICISIYDVDTPNWRLICLPKNIEEESSGRFSRMIYISNHCCSDGVSGVNLFRDIVQILNRMSPNGLQGSDTKTNTKVDRDSTIYDYASDWQSMSKLPLPITDRINYIPSAFKLAVGMIDALVRSVTDYKSPAQPITRITNEKPQTCFHETLRFTPHEVTRMRRKIREENCTVTAFLQTCLFVSLQQHQVFANRKWRELTFDMTIPSDTRKFLPEELATEQYKYGSNVGGQHYSFMIRKFDDKNFWDLCRQYMDTLRNGDQFIGFGLLFHDMVRKNQNVDKIIVDSYLGQRRGGVMLSNLGVYNQVVEDGKEMAWQIEDMEFLQNVSGIVFSYSVGVCTTETSGMNIALSVIEGALKDRDDFESWCGELDLLMRKHCDLN